jgi:dihydrofolate reductase
LRRARSICFSAEFGFADKFNNMPKYVVSSTLKDPDWTNSTVLEGDLRAAVTELKGRHGGDIVVHGSAQLSQWLPENDLVDELRPDGLPVVLGAGKRMFGETTSDLRRDVPSAVAASATSQGSAASSTRDSAYRT